MSRSIEEIVAEAVDIHESNLAPHVRELMEDPDFIPAEEDIISVAGQALSSLAALSTVRNTSLTDSLEMALEELKRETLGVE